MPYRIQNLQPYFQHSDLAIQISYLTLLSYQSLTTAYSTKLLKTATPLNEQIKRAVSKFDTALFVD